MKQKQFFGQQRLQFFPVAAPSRESSSWRPGVIGLWSSLSPHAGKWEVMWLHRRSLCVCLFPFKKHVSAPRNLSCSLVLKTNLHMLPLMSVPLLQRGTRVVVFRGDRKRSSARVCAFERERRDDTWVFEEWKETFCRSRLPLNIFVHFIANKNSKSISSSRLHRTFEVFLVNDLPLSPSPLHAHAHKCNIYLPSLFFKSFFFSPFFLGEKSLKFSSKAF